MPPGTVPGTNDHLHSVTATGTLRLCGTDAATNADSEPGILKPIKGRIRLAGTLMVAGTGGAKMTERVTGEATDTMVVLFAEAVAGKSRVPPGNEAGCTAWAVHDTVAGKLKVPGTEFL